MPDMSHKFGMKKVKKSTRKQSIKKQSTPELIKELYNADLVKSPKAFKKGLKHGVYHKSGLEIIRDKKTKSLPAPSPLDDIIMDINTREKETLDMLKPENIYSDLDMSSNKKKKTHSSRGGSRKTKRRYRYKK
jgi:hypothetical protein